MVDPISGAASVVTIADRVLAFGRWVLRKATFGRLGAPVSPYMRPPHSGLELVPVCFRVCLSTQLPYVTVAFWAINYSNRSIRLVSANVDRLYLPNGPTLERIPLAGEYELPSRVSWQVICQRALTDAEARVISSTTNRNSHSASLGISATGRQKRRDVEYGPVSNLSIEGSFEGLPSAGIA